MSPTVTVKTWQWNISFLVPLSHHSGPSITSFLVHRPLWKIIPMSSHNPPNSSLPFTPLLTILLNINCTFLIVRSHGHITATKWRPCQCSPEGVRSPSIRTVSQTVVTFHCALVVRRTAESNVDSGTMHPMFFQLFLIIRYSNHSYPT